VSSNSKEIAKLKKKYLKWPPNNNIFKNKSLILGYLPAALTIWILRRLLIRSDYKLKRESYKFFVLSHKAYGKNKSRKCDRHLRVATGLLEASFPNRYENLLRNAISVTSKNASARISFSSSILIATQKLEPSIFDATSWYQLSRGLFLLGYFRAAWVARENSLDLSILEISNSRASANAVGRAVEANLERCDLDSVRKILAEQKVIGPKSLASFRETLNWFETDDAKRTRDEPINLDMQELSFHELVHDKSVVVIGPGRSHDEYGVEIDSADIVARIKYPGAEYLLDKKFFGERCDISQYPSLMPLRELAVLSPYEYFDDLKFIVTGEADSRAVRNTPVFSEDQELPMYRTTVTSGLRLLISIIRRHPSSLKIFGYDFYSEREPYNSGMKSFYEQDAWKMGNGYLYGTNTDYPKSNIAFSFGAHDPVSNFCFAQNLYKAGLFDIEPYGKSILELTPYQYVERLEEMLGDW